MNRLFLIDAYALIYRSYYAFIGRPMRNAQGLNTSAIFGFTMFLREIIRREKPHHLGVAFDPKGGTFRHTMYPLYKANRSETPEDIHASVPYIKEILEAMKIPILEVAGYEADDVIGTLSHRASQAGFEVFMVTPDKDYGQLIDDNVYIYKQRKGSEGVEIIGREQIREHYGIDDPKLIIDILALWGDASDNIPGVMGIGEKGAIKLVNQFGTVENILANSDKLKGKQRENLEASTNQLAMAKVLATIDLNVPIDFEPDKLAMECADRTALKTIYQELGFTMFLRDLDNTTTMADAQPTDDSPAPQQAKQQQLAKLSAERSRQKLAASLQGQQSLFGEDAAETPVIPPPIPGALASQDEEFEPDENIESATTTQHTYTVVDNPESLKTLVARIGTYKEFCFDTETTGFDIFNDSIVGLSLAVEEFEAFYIPFNKSVCAEYTEILRPLFENESIAKIGQNIKFDIMVLRNIGLNVAGLKYDTMILHYLLDPESRHNMNYMSRVYLNYAPIEIETLIGKGSKQLTMDMVSVERVAEYAAEDADITLRLKNMLWAKVIEQGFEKLYIQIEEPLIEVLADIEMYGVNIDSNALNKLGEIYTSELAAIEDKIRMMADEPGLNVNSSRQLGEALFSKLRIDAKPKMTKTKQFRTDEEYLQSLSTRHPIIEQILEYRGIKKLLSTYIEALPLLVNRTTGKVHTSFNQAVTATGRLSSSNPNLQNIPIRDDRGREIRNCFIASDSSRSILSVDYSQVELRLMAHLSRDQALIDAFLGGEDIHSATAARLFGVAISDVTSDQRRKAKTANFGIIYGISAFGLAQRLNIPRHEAKEIIDGYFASYAGVKRYMEEVVVEAKGNGCVTTIFGRKRFLNDINSGNSIARSLAERNAINAPIQGSAADIMKIAMISAHRMLLEANLQSRVIMQVHDELVVDMVNDEKEEVIAIITQAMQNAAPDLLVPLTTEYGTGISWLDAH